MSKTANEQRALLTQKQQEADQAMEMIQKSMEGTSRSGARWSTCSSSSARRRSR